MNLFYFKYLINILGLSLKCKSCSKTFSSKKTMHAHMRGKEQHIIGAIENLIADYLIREIKLEKIGMS